MSAKRGSTVVELLVCSLVPRSWKTHIVYGHISPLMDVENVSSN